MAFSYFLPLYVYLNVISNTHMVTAKCNIDFCDSSSELKRPEKLLFKVYKLFLIIFRSLCSTNSCKFGVFYKVKKQHQKE